MTSKIILVIVALIALLAAFLLCQDVRQVGAFDSPLSPVSPPTRPLPPPERPRPPQAMKAEHNYSREEPTHGEYSPAVCWKVSPGQQLCIWEGIIFAPGWGGVTR